MNNFWRIIRLALRNKFSFAASVLCALMVGVLWCANIGAVYPVVEIMFSGQTPSSWVETKIADSQRVIDEFKVEIAVLENDQSSAEQDSAKVNERRIRMMQSRIEAESDSIAWYQWLGPYVDRYAPTGAMQSLVIVCVLIFLGTVLKGVFLIGQGILSARLAQKASYDLRNRFFRRALRMDVGMFSRQGVADMMSRFTNDLNAVSVGLTILFGKMVREPLKLVACVVGAALICPRLLLLTVVFMPVVALAIRWLGRMLKRANRKAMEETAVIYQRLEESFRSIRVIKAFTMEVRQRAQFMTNAREYYRKAMKIEKYNSLAHPMTEVLGFVMICMALAAGAYLVVEQQTHIFGFKISDTPLNSGSLILFYAMLFGAADPARKLSGIFSQVQQAAAASDRIYELLDQKPSVTDPKGVKSFPGVKRDIVFRDVEFEYESDEGTNPTVLHEINLAIKFGETVALVGPSGCGKSTLTSLIPRFADPTRGQLLMDGRPVDEIRLGDLRGQIGLVTQEPMLFNDTVEENIRFGKPDATPEEIVAAARAAHAHEFIVDKLSDGYGTIVGPMGGQLSGGQRQRIALARAIIRDPRILILDEATSQVDMQSEKLINEALSDFVLGRTTIIVTHRPRLLELADRIIVMEEGRIAEIGTHAELLQKNTYYAGLFHTKKAA